MTTWRDSARKGDPLKHNRRRLLATALAGLVLVSLAAPVVAQDPALHFSRLGAGDGLSQASVTAVAQDSLGFMWFGTQDGLNRFDGYDFRVFRNVPGDTGSLANAYVNDLVVDREGVLWVATFGGLHRYDAETGDFQRFTADPDDPAAVPADIVRDLHLSEDGALWAGTTRGVARLDRASGAFTSFPVDPDGGAVDVRAVSVGLDGHVHLGTPEGLLTLDPVTGRAEPFVLAGGGAPVPEGTFVWHLHTSRDGTLWVGTGGLGLVEIDPERRSARVHRPRSGDPTSLPGADVRAVFEEGDSLWVGTMTGLAALDSRTGRAVRYTHDPLDPRSLSQNAVWAIDRSREGLLWFGTAITGVSVHDPLTRQFEHYRSDPVGGRGLSHRVVYGIVGDGEGTVWLGTREGGLNRWNRSAGTLTAYRHDPEDPGTVSSDYVNALASTPDGSLWAGTYDAGLNRVDPETGRVQRFRHRSGDPSTLGSDRVRTLAVDHDGTLWIGLSGDGLDRYDPETGRLTHYTHDPASLSGGFVRGLMVDRDGALWVAMYGTGVNRLDEASGTFRRYRHDPDDPGSLGSDFVRSAFQDSSGRYWFATDTGLNLLVDEENGRFRRYGVEDGLPNPVVYGVLEDDRGRLWMSTNEGLARLDPSSDEMVTFDVGDGLQANEFNTGAFFREADGLMYFGGVGGLTVFDPEAIRLDPAPPAVVLTGFRLFNEPVAVSDSSALTVQPPLVREVTLGPDDRVLTFEFAALSYRDPLRTRYEYRLDGLHDGWLPTTSDNRRATFTSLDPGQYTFRVRAATRDGVWSDDEVSLGLVILPAFWETTWFRGGAALLLIGLMGGGVMLRQRSLEHRNELLERRVEERLIHIKRLEGLLPICSSCKKIRLTEDDTGDQAGWVPIESYISGRTDADFSHGICPTCSDEIMAEVDRGG
ncbi:MAG: two-component regulator propeller domain-containing protein [Gemmatimonadota bacterium]